MKNEIKKALTDAMYLKSRGWTFEKEEERWGWIDPKTKVHYFAEDALLMQLIRDNKDHKRFAREPRHY